MVNKIVATFLIVCLVASMQTKTAAENIHNGACDSEAFAQEKIITMSQTVVAAQPVLSLAASLVHKCDHEEWYGSFSITSEQPGLFNRERHNALVRKMRNVSHKVCK